MKFRTLTFSLSVLLYAFSLAAEKPDFTGTWVFDQDKSLGFPQGLEQTMTITHNGDQIKLEGKQ